MTTDSPARGLPESGERTERFRVGTRPAGDRRHQLLKIRRASGRRPARRPARSGGRSRPDRQPCNPTGVGTGVPRTPSRTGGVLAHRWVERASAPLLTSERRPNGSGPLPGKRVAQVTVSPTSSGMPGGGQHSTSFSGGWTRSPPGVAGQHPGRRRPVRLVPEHRELRRRLPGQATGPGRGGGPAWPGWPPPPSTCSSERRAAEMAG